jgi:hypothetical protein
MTPDPDDQSDETPSGSTDSAENDGSGDTDNTGDDLDAPDPA